MTSNLAFRCFCLKKAPNLLWANAVGGQLLATYPHDREAVLESVGLGGGQLQLGGARPGGRVGLDVPFVRGDDRVARSRAVLERDALRVWLVRALRCRGQRHGAQRGNAVYYPPVSDRPV